MQFGEKYPTRLNTPEVLQFDNKTQKTSSVEKVQVKNLNNSTLKNKI